jgi:predicted RNase H-like nuclease
MHARVLGVDACKKGWVGVGVGDTGPTVYFGRHIGDVVAAAEYDGPLGVVGIDIPIGLPDNGRRQADVLARAVVGPRRSSVFMTPVRDALLAEDHARAVVVNRERTGEGLSIQAFGLKRKLLEVEAWAQSTHHTVIEVHPEVCFAQIAGAPLATRKSTWAGAEERRSLLEGAGMLPQGLNHAGTMAAVDDVLDAAAVAWTARRHSRGEARSLPDIPEVFSDGRPCAVWY